MEVNQSKKDEAQAEESKGKTGVIPNEEVKGSDADSAYNEDQEFEKLKRSEPKNEMDENA